MPVFRPMPTADARRYQAGEPDAYGNRPEPAVSDGSGNPCRHCLHDIPAGAPMLILAYCPFPARQPYAETGPVFLCADPCPAWDGAGVPPVLASSDSYLVRGYGADDRIVYGSGAVVAKSALTARAGALLERPEIAYLHVRSATNNCWQARVERA